jgi:TM2 domain-containing membrane protein YozV
MSRSLLLYLVMVVMEHLYFSLPPPSFSLSLLSLSLSLSHSLSVSIFLSLSVPVSLSPLFLFIYTAPRNFLMQRRCNYSTGKRWTTAFLLSFTLGGFGVDRFYLNHWATACGKIITFGGLGVWSILDVILIGTGYLGPADGSAYIYWQSLLKIWSLQVIINFEAY